MARIGQLPTNFLENMVRANPGTQEFSNGFTRQQIVEELTARGVDLEREMMPKTEIKSLTQADAITVFISTSPLFSNPNTEIIDETYAQIRKQMPEVQTYLLMDGVHPEEIHLAEKYESFKENVRAKNWPNFKTIEFKEWHHQSGMLREVLIKHQLITTPLIFWTEHDLPLSDDFIDWTNIIPSLLSGEVASIRFQMFGGGPKPNKEHGRYVTRQGVPLIRTTQHTAWAQVIRTSYMTELVREFGDAKTYYDDGLRDGFLDRNFQKYICGIYAPNGDIHRCYHNNGRSHGMPLSVEADKPYMEYPDRKDYCYGKPYKPYLGS